MLREHVIRGTEVFWVWSVNGGGGLRGHHCVCPCVYSGLCMCVCCPAVYLLAHLNVCVHSSFFSTHSSSCPAPRSPRKSLRYFHSSVSVLIFTLISWLVTGAPRPVCTSHNPPAMFTTPSAKTGCLKTELAKNKTPAHY